jgi:hypothetical protein
VELPQKSIERRESRGEEKHSEQKQIQNKGIESDLNILNIRNLTGRD